VEFVPVPRIPNDIYLNRHNFLRKLWLEAKNVFGFLHYNQQHDLHSYYLPDEDLTKDELLAHRKRMSKLDPSLSSRAGKSFSQLWARLEEAAEKAKSAKKSPTQKAPRQRSTCRNLREL
jgi:hypothetical protein